MEANKLKEILERHKMWLNGEEGGEKADLKETDLRRVDLNGANLRVADLRGANLNGADLDYVSYPLYCNGLCIHIDDRIGIQLLYHAISNILFSHNTSDTLKEQVSALVDTANKFHRVDECGELKPFVKEATNNE